MPPSVRSARGGHSRLGGQGAVVDRRLGIAPFSILTREFYACHAIATAFGQRCRRRRKPSSSGVSMLEHRALGGLTVTDDGDEVSVGGPRQRRLVAMLLVHRNAVVSADRLNEAVFPGDPTPAARTTLRSYVARLGKVTDGDGSCYRPRTRIPAPGHSPLTATEAPRARREVYLTALTASWTRSGCTWGTRRSACRRRRRPGCRTDTAVDLRLPCWPGGSAGNIGGTPNPGDPRGRL